MRQHCPFTMQISYCMTTYRFKSTLKYDVSGTLCLVVITCQSPRLHKSQPSATWLFCSPLLIPGFGTLPQNVTSAPMGRYMGVTGVTSHPPLSEREKFILQKISHIRLHC